MKTIKYGRILTHSSRFHCLYRILLKIYFLKQETEQCVIVDFRQEDTAALFKTLLFIMLVVISIFQHDSIHVVGAFYLAMAVATTI